LSAQGLFSSASRTPANTLAIAKRIVNTNFLNFGGDSHQCVRYFPDDFQGTGADQCADKRQDMNRELSIIYLARHGETAWSRSGQHTGLTDLPLTQHGEHNARSLGKRLAGLKFTKIFTSPLQRATRTCELAGFEKSAEVDHDLLEWNYGQYEGRTTADILGERPGWQLFRDGCPGGETPAQVGTRAQRVLNRLRAIHGDALLFSSGHFLRVLAACWLGLNPTAGSCFLLSTASLSALSYDHNPSEPAIQIWNDTRHVLG
jgi:probable phosphoglycerate mutase